MSLTNLRPYPLRELVLIHHADVPQASSGEQPMETDELLDYLAGIERLDISPLQAVIDQTEAIGDPALPGALQARILAWVGEAFDHWQREFPLEQALADRLRLLLPTIASIAVTQPDFLIAGKHPMHRILDTAYDYAVGWQPNLGRLGDSVQVKVNSTIDELLGYFNGGNTDIEQIAIELVRIAERDRSRAQRMAQRVAETEQGRLKAIEARTTAATMINELLLQYGLPQEIGTFIKGPWYDSAQLILLKFGANSDAWQKLRELTGTLVDSVQPSDGHDEERQQYLTDVVTRIPRALKYWLVSLQHDPAASTAAIQPIDVCHLRILRNQPVTLTHIEPLPLPPNLRGSGGTQSASIASLVNGQWFRIQTGPDDIQRVQLVLKSDAEELLMFTNQAGIKALQLEFAEFGRLLGDKSALPLDYGASFTRSLHRAAGIASDEAFTAILRREEEEARRLQQEREAEEQRIRDKEQRIRDAQQRKLKEEADKLARLEAERLAQEEEQRKILEEQARQAREEAVRKMQEAAEQEARDEIAAAEARYLRLRKHARHLRRDEGNPLDLSKSMGAWMGFHDGDAPMMARLVVHDPDQGLYIFVNREGIKLREIHSLQLSALVDQGLVDIIDPPTDFRAELARAQTDIG